MVKLTESSARPQFDPSLQNLMRLIGKKFQLNNLQLLTVSVLLMRVCRVDKRRGHGFESRLSEQFLTYIGGKAGTGKDYAGEGVSQGTRYPRSPRRSSSYCADRLSGCTHRGPHGPPSMPLWAWAPSRMAA
jgi:hypothetical protein